MDGRAPAVGCGRIRREPDRLSPCFLLELRPAAEFRKEAGVRLAAFNRAMAQGVGRDLPQEGRRVGDKAVILLINRARDAPRADHTPLESAEIAIVLHFRVTDQSLAPNPAEENRLLGFRRIHTKAIAGEHNGPPPKTYVCLLLTILANGATPINPNRVRAAHRTPAA